MILDNRGLEPPEPMLRTLKMLETLAEGEKLTIINDRRPMFLYSELESMGYAYTTTARQDGAFEIMIIKRNRTS